MPTKNPAETKVVTAAGKEWSVSVEKCSRTHLLVGSVAKLPGAHSQGATWEELKGNLCEVIEMILAGKDK